jgi:predicted GIY-YIG superfamily endonuclease
MIHVYDLLDTQGKTVDVGVTLNLTQRLYQHTKKRPDGTSRFGKWYGHNLEIVSVGMFQTRKEAMKVEGERKLSLGMEWTESTGRSKGGHTQARVLNNTKTECPHCGKILYNKGAMGMHLKHKH